MEPQVYSHLRREVERNLFHMLYYANVNKKMMQKFEALPTHIANWGKKLCGDSFFEYCPGVFYLLQTASQTNS